MGRSRITGERPPIQTDTKLAEYLNRMFRDARISDDAADELIVRSTYPENPKNGKLYYFSAAISGTDIDAPGYWGYIDSTWCKLNQCAELADHESRIDALETGSVNAFVNAEKLLSAYQRSSSVPAATVGANDAVWNYWNNSSVGVVTFSDGADAIPIPTPNGAQPYYLNKVEVTTAAASSSGRDGGIYTYIEGNDLWDLLYTENGNAVLSFWVRSSVTGTYAIRIQNHGTGATKWQYVTTYTVDAADTWEFKELIIPADFLGSTNFRHDGDWGIQVYFMIQNDLTPNATLNTWVNNSDLGVSGHANLMASVGNKFYIGCPKFEL